MINLRNSPFLWLALVLILSYTLGDLVSKMNYGWFLFLSGLMMLACLYGSVLKYNPSWKYLSTLSISCFVFLAGIWKQNQFEKELFPDALRSEATWMEGQIVVNQVLKSKENSISIQGVVN